VTAAACSSGGSNCVGSTGLKHPSAGFRSVIGARMVGGERRWVNVFPTGRKSWATVMGFEKCRFPQGFRMEVPAQCRDIALPFYGDLLKSSQDTLRQRLFEQAEKATSNEDQRCFYDAIQVLNHAAVQMLNQFKDDLLNSYQQFAAGKDVVAISVPA